MKNNDPAAASTLVHSSRDVVLAWVLVSALLLLLLWLVVLSEMRRETGSREEAALKIVGQLVDAQTRRLQAELADIEQILTLLASAREAGANSALLDRQMRAVADRRPIFPFYVNVNGIVSSARMPAGLGVDMRSDPLFVEAQRDNGSKLRVYRGRGFGALDGQSVIRFATRVLRDGAFDGVMVLTVTEAYFRALGASSAATLDESSGIWFSDGRLLAGLRGTEAGLPRRIRDGLSQLGAAGVISDADPGDGAEKFYVGWRRLPEYGLLVTTAVPRRELLGEQQNGADSRLALGLVNTLLILFACWQGARVQLHRQQRRRERQAISSTFRLAVDSAREAFYMLAAVPVEGSRALRFRIEDCNEFAATLSESPRSHLVGQHFPDIFPNMNSGQIEEMLQTALREGFCETELLSDPSDGREARWLSSSAVRSFGGLAVTVRDITELKEKEGQLRSMAMTDALTMLPNRHWLKQRLPESIAAARANGMRIALLFIDLDDFKKINDALGHQAGDEFLVSVAAALRNAVRRQDSVIRLGGDEFTILVEAVESRDSVEAIGRQIIHCFEAIESESTRRGLVPRGSVGAALFPDDASDDAALMQAADIAMYAAKSEGKGRLCMYSADLAHQVQSRLQLEQGLREALLDQRLSLRYQPRVCAHSGAPVALEALLRWQRDDGETIDPENFIALAEQSDLILEVGKWVAAEACRQIAEWQGGGLRPPPVSINVSGRQLRSDAFRLHVGEQLARHGLSPSQLAIELTESVMVGDEPGVREELSELRRMGIELHIDDFGTGYSSLSQLQNLEVDTIKIDQSFVQAIGSRQQGKILCEAMVQMARTLGFRVVAEGVESPHQLHELQRMLCDEVQGFLISRPVEAAEAARLLALHSLFEVLPFGAIRAA